MNNASPSVNAWEQMQLVEPVATELTLRIGLVPSSGHMQAQIEIHEATSQKLLAMQSWPHSAFEDADALLKHVQEVFRQAVERRTGPF